MGGNLPPLIMVVSDSVPNQREFIMAQDAHLTAISAAPTPPRESGSVLQKLPLHLIESAGFLALVSAILYFMGYSMRDFSTGSPYHPPFRN
jgi:hypothetical protein